MTFNDRLADLENRADELGAQIAKTLNGLLDALDEDMAAYRCYLAADGSDLTADKEPEQNLH